MERNSFSVLFFLKKTKLLKNGEASVCMRITVNNVRSETNIRKSITPSLWNQAKECSRGKDRKSNDLNKYIEEARIKLYNIHAELKKESLSITATILRDKFFNLEEKEEPKKAEIKRKSRTRYIRRTASLCWYSASGQRCRDRYTRCQSSRYGF